MNSLEAELGKLHQRLKDSVSVISQCLVHTQTYLASQDSHSLRRQKELRTALEKDKARWDDFARFAVGLSAAAVEVRTGEQRTELAGDWGQVTRLLAATQRKLGQRLQGSEGLLWEEFAELNKALWECFCRATAQSTEAKLRDVIRQQEQRIGKLQNSLRTSTEQITVVHSANLSPRHTHPVPVQSECTTPTRHRNTESAQEARDAGHRRPELGSLRKELEDLVRQRDEVRAIVRSKGSSPLRPTGAEDLLRLEKERSQAFYKALKQKEKDCRQLHVSSASVQALQQELTTLKNQAQPTQLALDSAHMELAALQQEVEQLKSSNKLLDAQVKEGYVGLESGNGRKQQDLEAKLRKLESAHERMQQEKDKMLHESRNLRENLQEKQGKIENLAKLLEEVHNSYKENTLKLGFLKEEIHLQVKTASYSQANLFKRLTESVFLLETKLKAVQTLLSSKHQFLTASNTHKSHLETQLSDFKSHYAQEKDASERLIASLKAEISTFQGNLQDSGAKYRTEIQTLQGDFGQLKARHEELTKANADLKEKVKRARADLTSSELRVEERDHSIVALQAALQAQSRELGESGEARLQLDSVRKELGSAKSLSVSQAREIATLQGKITGLNEDLAAARAAQASAALSQSEAAAHSSKRLEELLDIQEALTQKLNSTRAEVKAKTGEVSKSEREVHSLREKVREIETKLSEEMEEVESLRTGKRQFGLLQALKVGSGQAALQGIAAIQGKAVEQSQAIAALEAQKAALQADLQQKQTEIVSNEELFANLLRENAALKLQLQSTHSQIGTLHKDSALLQSQIDRITSDLNTSETANKALISDLESAKNSEFVTSSNLSKLKSAYDQLLADTHLSSNSLHGQIASMTSAIEDMKAEQARIQAASENLRREKEAEVGQLEGKLRVLREEVGTLGVETGSAEDSESVLVLLKAEMEGLRQGKARLEEHLESASSERQLAQSRLADLLSEKQALAAQLTALQQHTAAVQAESVRGREEAELLRNRELKLVEDLEAMRKSASDGQKQQLSDAERLAEQFRASELFYKRLLEEADREKERIQAKLEAAEQFYSSKIQKLSENCALLEDQNSSLLTDKENSLREQKLLSEKLKIAEIEADQLRVLTESREKVHLAVSQKLEETTSRLSQAEQHKQALIHGKEMELAAKSISFSTEKRHLEAQVAHLTDSLSASKEAIQTLSLQLASTGEATAQLKWKLSESEGQYQAAAERTESLDQQLTDATLEIAALRSSLQTAEADSLSSKQQSATLIAELTQVREVYKKLTLETAKMDSEMQTIREESESLRRTLAAEQVSAGDTAADLESLQARLRAWTQEKLRLEQQCTALAEELEEERKSRLEAGTEVRRLGEELAAERVKVERLFNAHRETQAQLAQSELETSNLLIKNTDLTSEIATLGDKLTEFPRLPLHPEVIMKPLTPHTPHSFSFHSSEDFGFLGEEADFPLIVTSKSMTGEVNRAVETAVQAELEKLFENVDFEGFMRDIERKIVNLMRKLANSADVLGLVKASIRKRVSDSDAEDGPGAPQPSLQPHSICLGLQFEGRTWVLERTSTDFVWKEHPIQLDPVSIPLLLTEDQISHMHTLEAQLRQKTIQMDEAEELHLAKTQEFDQIKQLLTDRGFNFQGQSLLAVVQSALAARRPPAGSRGSSPIPKRLSGLTSEFSDLALGVEKESASPAKVVMTLTVPRPEQSNQSSDSMALSEAEASSLFSTIDKLRRENDDMSKHNDDLERQVTLLKQKLRERELSPSEPVSGAELSSVLQNLLEVLPLQ